LGVAVMVALRPAEDSSPTPQEAEAAFDNNVIQATEEVAEDVAPSPPSASGPTPARSERERRAEHQAAIDGALNLAIQKLAHEIAKAREKGRSARDIAELEAKKARLERQLSEREE